MFSFYSLVWCVLEINKSNQMKSASAMLLLFATTATRISRGLLSVFTQRQVFEMVSVTLRWFSPQQWWGGKNKVKS